MSILPVFGGGGGGYTAPTSPSNNEADTTESGAAEQTSESQDTAAPAAASESADSGTNTTSGQTDQQSQQDRIALQIADAGPTTAQSVVEAQLEVDPVVAEADARRMAITAQQQQRLEMLIEAVGTPMEVTQIAPAAADQAAVGNVESDGIVV